DGGLRTIGGLHKWVFKGNWKFAAEQFASDMYHAPISHASAFMSMASTDRIPTAEELAVLQGPGVGAQFTSELGHGMGFYTDDGVHWRAGMPGELDEYYKRRWAQFVERLGVER